VFRFIDAQKAVFHITTMCRLLGVTPQGYYAWRKRPRSPRARADAELTAAITRIFAQHEGDYGAPRIHAELFFCDGWVCGHNRVARLMRNAGLAGRSGRRPGPKTTRRVEPEPRVPDLVARRFDAATRPDQIWSADISYIPTWQGWLYLAFLLDLFSRMIVGWAMAEHMRTELVADALKMARTRRLPPAGLIHHSDRGAQYLSADYQAQLRGYGMLASAGRVGVCWDNAIAESWLGRFKVERIHPRVYPTHAAARTGVYEYIKAYYNRRRRHSALGYRSPLEYEQLWVAGQRLWTPRDDAA
jgi:putative transposase